MPLIRSDAQTDILLVNPPNRFDDRELRPSLSVHHPLGIMSLAASLRQAGLKVKIIDGVAEYDQGIEEILDRLERERTPILGLSLTSPQSRGGYQLAMAAKARFGDAITVAVGGAHISADPGFIQRFPEAFDLSLAGEGEITFTALAQRILGGEKVRGMFNGEKVEDLDSLPWVARDLVNKHYYSQMPFGSDFTLINTIRGCPFHCTFCSNPVYSRKVRYRSLDNVIEEVKYCVNELGTKYINIQDDTLTLKRSRFLEFCQRLLQEKIKVKWGGATRANLINEELIALMAKSGCVDLNFGVEVGNEAFRSQVVKKGVSSAEIENAFRLTSKYGIETGALCMLGFPGETRELMQETVTFVKRIKPDIFGFHITILMPGSDLYEQAIREGKLERDLWDRYVRGEVTHQPPYIPDGLTLEEMKQIQMNSYRQYYFTPGYLMRRFLRDITSYRRFRNDFMIGWNLLFNRGTGTGRV